MKITIVQPDTAWNAVDTNLSRASGLIAATGETDLIVLPETFNTGYMTANADKCADYAANTVKWMRDMSEKKQAAVCASLFEKSGSSIFNRLYFIAPGYPDVTYDKRHLFLGEEKNTVKAGTSRVIVEYAGWRILLQICYDLRFPVWTRNRDDYDLAVFVANWPEARREAWKILLRARAVENQCYVAGVNRTGTDPAGVEYAGESMLIDPYGREILTSGSFRETTGSAQLSMEMLRQYRTSFPVLPDRDEFIITA